MRMLAAALFLLPLVLWNPLSADTQYTILTIDVRDATSKRSVHQASVTVNFITARILRKDLRREWNSKTNRRGLVEFPEIPSGKVRVQVIAPAYRTAGEIFEISGEEHTAKINLERPKKRQVSAHEPPELEKKPVEGKNKEEKQSK